MPDLPASVQRVCAADELLEKGKAVLFDVVHFGQPARGFVLRYDGKLLAYLNRCTHVPTELDWQPGEFLDSSREYIICAVHGAAYEPKSGRCVGGPCGRGKLLSLQMEERDGQVYWYPSRETTPALIKNEPPSAASPADERLE